MALASSLFFLKISKCRSMVLESEAILIAEELCACSSPTISALGDKTHNSASSFIVSFRGTKMPVSTDLSSAENAKVSVNFFFPGRVVVSQTLSILPLLFPSNVPSLFFFFCDMSSSLWNCKELSHIFPFQASLCPGLFILVSTRV